MRNWIVSVLLLCAPVPAAAERLIVELTEPPAAEAAFDAARGRRTAVDAQRDRVVRQQHLVERLLSREDVRVLHRLDTLLNAVIVEADGPAARVLARLDGVKAVHRAGSVQLAMDKALELHNVGEAWWWMGQENAGKGVKIAIIDTGIDTTHPAFNPAGFTMPPGYPRGNTAGDLALATPKVIVYRSFDALAPEDKRGGPEDCGGHGTMVASCAAAVPVDAPAAGFSGVAPAAYLGAYKVFPGCHGKTGRDIVLAGMEAAVADGMDILNLSLGGAPALSPEMDLVQAAANRAARLGVLITGSAGNSGPTPGTVGAPAKMGPNVLGVGAAENGRELAVTAVVEGVRYKALPGDMPRPAAPVSGLLVDVSRLDGAGTACGALPSGSLAASIAFILRGGCDFEVKLNNAGAAGAVGALLYSDDRPPTPMATNGATLPGMMITNTEGLEIKAKFPAGGTLSATLDFDYAPYEKPHNRIADFSSIGPGPRYLIKPDLAAIGESVYVARSRHESGEAGGYGVTRGTSFSAPIVAGAAAVLEGMRPGLTPMQQMSLLVNTADLMQNDGGQYLPLMSQGAGRMNLGRATATTVTASPVSVSFGANPTGTVQRRLLITNTGLYPDSYSATVEAFRPPRAPTVEPANFNLGRGQSAWVTLRFDTFRASAGLYEGVLHIQGSHPGSRIHIPYWMGVGDGSPYEFTKYDRDSENDFKPNTVETVYTRINDRYGIAITNPPPEVSVQSGGGSVEKVYIHPAVPENIAIDFKLGAGPGWHCLNISFGGLATTECFWIAE